MELAQRIQREDPPAQRQAHAPPHRSAAEEAKEVLTTRCVRRGSHRPIARGTGGDMPAPGVDPDVDVVDVMADSAPGGATSAPALLPAGDTCDDDRNFTFVRHVLHCFLQSLILHQINFRQKMH